MRIFFHRFVWDRFRHGFNDYCADIHHSGIISLVVSLILVDFEHFKCWRICRPTITSTNDQQMKQDFLISESQRNLSYKQSKTFIANNNNRKSNLHSTHSIVLRYITLTFISMPDLGQLKNFWLQAPNILTQKLKFFFTKLR